MFRKYFLSNRIYYIILNLFLLIIFITALKSCTKQVTTVKSSDEIRSAIIKRVVNNEHLPYSDIRISIQDRIVILQGEAPTLYIKEKAAQVIKTIKEVRTVINRLKLKEYHVNDARLQNQVYDSLKTNMLTKNSQIESSIRLGVATLKGVVHLNAVKKCASSIVKKIHGIKGVYNDLYISPRFNITGVKIKETLLFSLKNNPFVYNRFIDVKISNGVVTFSGMVGSMAEKQEVRYIAQKIGVKK